jgi:XTP/dITP diphosphohydrolase
MGAPVDRLVEVMDRLRSPGGCPWDAEQTHQSLARYLLEETYETLEAMDRGDLKDLREELGDLLLQVVFHARIAEESDSTFTLDAIAQGVVDKLVRRHPHVFEGQTVASSAELEENWAAIKAQEKPRESVTEGVPPAMPSLQVATQLIYRSRNLPVRASDGTLAERLRPLLGDLDEAAIGDALVAVVELAREKDIEAESVLRARMGQFRREIRTAEGLG